jgi:hypothetical protein
MNSTKTFQKAKTARREQFFFGALRDLCAPEKAPMTPDSSRQACKASAALGCMRLDARE